MNTTLRNLITGIVAVSAMGLAGCAVYPAYPGYADGPYSYGPPPYAPAPGYRTSYPAHNMRYDGQLGVYVLLDLPDHYYFNNVYYKYSRNNWFYRYQDRDKWRSFDGRKLPPGLARKYQDYDRRDNNRRDYRDRDWRS